MAYIKVKEVQLTNSVKPPGRAENSPSGGIHISSFNGERFEIYKGKDEIWITRDNEVISVPLVNVKRIDYYKLEDTPIEQAREDTRPARPVGRPPTVGKPGPLA